jgi:carboxypeptidase Q
MQKVKAVWLCLFLSSICLAAIPSETDDTNRIIQIALQPSPLESNLRHLTDEVGGRIPGTPAMQRAVDWGVQVFKAAGADSVHTEEFTIPNSWAEGATEMTVSATGTALDPKLAQIPKV